MTEEWSSNRPSDGNHFEDFHFGQRLRHATPRTVSEGDQSLYIALTGARQPTFSSKPLSVALGYRDKPIDDWLVFNMAFGKTVPDISANAIANLGYADVRFLEPVFSGDTLSAMSEVIGIRETSGGASGVVYVRSTAYNQDDRPVLTWIRWVLVRKRDPLAHVNPSAVPNLPSSVEVSDLVLPPVSVNAEEFAAASGSGKFWDDFDIGERIDHSAGMTLDESDHTLATKLYQNNAKVHFDALAMAQTSHRRRLIYGGHVISVCRALAYEGLENVICTLAINGGAHRAPTFAGDTLYCFSQVLEKLELPGRTDAGALRLRLVGIRNNPAGHFSDRIMVDGKERFHPDVVLDLDYTVLVARAAR